jgi:hypothetical protein
MNMETPLTEVAHHLPAETAGALGEFPQSVQVATLGAIRLTVSCWEEAGVSLDPMQYAVLLSTLTKTLSTTYAELFALQHRLAALELQREGT